MLETDPDVYVINLRTEDDSDSIACGFEAPRLSWRLSSKRMGVKQIAYEIEIADDIRFEISRVGSGEIVCTRPFLAPWPTAPLKSREVKWWRVRVKTQIGWTNWSAPSRIEASLLNLDDWIAKPISHPKNVGQKERSPAQLVRREFIIESEVTSARIYITALGIHETWINGKRISEDRLEPGWTNYRSRIPFAVYDISELLNVGSNSIASIVGEGWWRGELTWMERRAIYGATTALIAQIEIETKDFVKITIATDETWRTSFGAIELAEIYDGCDIDFRAEECGWEQIGFNDSHWECATIIPLSINLTTRTWPAVKPLQIIKTEIDTSRTNSILVDTGQNLTGYLRIKLTGPNGAKVSVTHSEILQSNGALHTAPLRNARACDNYFLDNRVNFTLEPLLTFHGFRYAQIDVTEGVSISSIEIIVIGSALDYTGSFECSNNQINKLFSNCVWSQRSNFVSIPMDCPQRDERLGWTGDIQVFSEAACANADCRSFLKSWLEDLATEQRDDGNVTSTVPNVIQGHEFEYGGVGWGDAATIIPYNLYEAYGDKEILGTQYQSMKKWVDYCNSRRGQDGIWRGDFHLGDWLDPSAPPDKPENATTDRDFIANAYLARSALCLAESARIIGNIDDEAKYRELSQEVKSLCWANWQVDALKTQTGCAIAIEFDIAPKEDHIEIGKKLAELVFKNGGKIGTGFIGTPLILPALTKTRQLHAASKLIQNRECPGWLFQVEKGATTLWERWDAIGTDGELHSGDMSGEEREAMISYNHYAYGSVAAWLYRSLAGLVPDRIKVGYEKIVFAPNPIRSICSAGASLVTQFGKTAINWRIKGNEIEIALEIPAGATGELYIPTPFRQDKAKTPLIFGSGFYRLKFLKSSINRS